ncbi:hypothetical protein J6590_012483 [Homalodisca vitripennis]|nr:hypothetical protein J6590_012483 [Homalodisca vitripennis]
MIKQALVQIRPAPIPGSGCWCFDPHLAHLSDMYHGPSVVDHLPLQVVIYVLDRSGLPQYPVVAAGVLIHTSPISPTCTVVPASSITCPYKQIRPAPVPGSGCWCFDPHLAHLSDMYHGPSVVDHLPLQVVIYVLDRSGLPQYPVVAAGVLIHTSPISPTCTMVPASSITCPYK